MTPPPSPPPAADNPSWYLIPVDAADRGSLLAALQMAAQAMHEDLGCESCRDLACQDPQHLPRLNQIRSWRTLSADINRLPGTTDDQPLIRFDPHACRSWLATGAAQQAGIDDGFPSDAFTIAAGVEELLRLLSDEPGQQFWHTPAHLHNINIWRTADNDGVDGGGGSLTADVDYMGQRMRLATLHQGHDEFTDSDSAKGIDAAVQALAHVAHKLNEEYAVLRQVTGHPAITPPPGPGNTDVYTVIGVWLGEQPVPVGVVAGEHQVSGGDEGEYFPEGVWATSVCADDDLEAEREAIDEMRDTLD